LKLLAIDTSTEACSAAVYSDGETLHRYEVAPRKHAELILPMVDQLLAEMELNLTHLDALAFGRGPGAFTGVRIAAGVIQGLAFATELPVIPVSSLATLAQGGTDQSQAFISAIDARMGEIYAGVYTTDVDKRVISMRPEVVCKPDDFISPEGDSWFGIGSGWLTYDAELKAIMNGRLGAVDGNRFPHSKDIIPLAIREYEQGNLLPPQSAIPVYLRDQVTG